MYTTETSFRYEALAVMGPMGEGPVTTYRDVHTVVQHDLRRVLTWGREWWKSDFEERGISSPFHQGRPRYYVVNRGETRAHDASKVTLLVL